ncbi:MAG: Anti-sigma factor antagonist [Pedosphaera sp.]|nr:Anti-sigma factor antagonist [Pedosphaera sp.]
MKICREGETINVTDVKELGLANSDLFGSEVLAALDVGVRNIVIDLSVTDVVDCSGLGALVGLYKAARRRGEEISVQIVNPTRLARQVMSLTKLDDFFLSGRPAF